jgi:hypothetical protein
MKDLAQALLKFIESSPDLDRFTAKIFKNKTHKKQEVKASITTLFRDHEGKDYLAYLFQLLQKESIDSSHIKHFFALRNRRRVPKDLQEHYAVLAEVVLCFLLADYSNRRIEHGALYMIADFFMVRKADFILLAPSVFQVIIEPHDLTPPIIEKLCETLIEHYHIEDIIIFLICNTHYTPPQILKIIHALSFGQKLYRKKREKRHRLLDKDKVSRMWFHTPFKTFKRGIIHNWRAAAGLTAVNDREVEAFIEKQTLEEIQKKFIFSRLNKNIDEQKPSFIEKLGLELVMLRNNEDIFARLVEMVPARKKLLALSKYMWMFMRLLRMRSYYDDVDKEKIHGITVQYAFQEIAGTIPVIFYIEDNGRYHNEFTRHITFECQSLELATPRIIVYPTIGAFRDQMVKITEETRAALAHIFIIDGILADGSWRDVLSSVAEVELRLWELRKETLYSVKYLFTGDIDIAREAYQAKIVDRVPLDGVFIKPLESWDNTFLEISLRVRKTGIQTDDMLYQRIVNIVKEVMT